MAKRILIVEDEVAILEILEMALEMMGHQTLGVQTGENLISVIEQFIPDLILLDIKLREYNGLELCKLIKENPNFSSIAVVIITAYGQQQQDKALESGANDVMLKPFDISQLEMIVQKWSS